MLFGLKGKTNQLYLTCITCIRLVLVTKRRVFKTFLQFISCLWSLSILLKLGIKLNLSINLAKDLSLILRPHGRRVCQIEFKTQIY